ncbi:MAG: LysR family transcriptional regulator [Atopobiaceae bacterium]|jgi:DNA-binding transcriptional LysR family regulator
MDTWKAQVFLKAIDTGSLSKAARYFGYTPSGVSHMMDAFEGEIGFPLMIRTKQGVAPTQNGMKIIPLIRDACGKDEQLSQAISEIKGLATGTLRISSYASVASEWLPFVIAAFHKDFPHIRIDLFEGVWQEVSSSLADHQADIGFYSYFPSIPYRWVPLKDDPMMVVVPPNHPLAHQSSVRVEQLEGETLIFPAYGVDVDVLRLIEGTNIKVEYNISTLYNYPAFRMVEQNLGLVITNRLITQGLNLNAAVLPIEPASSIELGIAIPAESESTPAVSRFVDYALHIIPTL